MSKLDKIIEKIKNDKQNFLLKKFLKIVDYYWKDYKEFVADGRDVVIKNVEDIKTKIDFSSLKLPKEITIKNAKEIADYIVIPKNEVPDSVEVNNLGDLSKYFEVLNKIEIPKEFSIKNIKDISKVEFPENLKKLSSQKTEEVLGKVLLELRKNKPKEDVFIRNKDPKEYIPVRVVDKRGEDWLKDFGQTIVAARSSVYLYNTNKEQINPATEEKQDGFIEKQIDGTQKTQLVDNIGRQSLNTIFGEQIHGVRRADIASQFQYGYPAGNADTDTANGGTIATVESMLIVSTSNNIAGSAGINNKKALRYLPGHEAYIVFTAVFTEGVADSYQRGGLFDSNNGFFIGYEGEDFKVTRRRDGTDVRVGITLDDVFTGFDPTKGNVYKISFGYLGFATIIFEVLKSDGSWTSIHKIEYPNTATVTHILNTNLQPRMEVVNTGNNTDISMKVGSFTAGIVDGGRGDPTARRFTVGKTAQAIVAGTLMVITFRNKSSFASLVNYIQSQLTLLSFNSDLSKSSLWELEKNATITNSPTWADLDTDDSIMEASTDAVVTRGTGQLNFSVPLGKVDRVLITDLEEQEIELLPEDTMTLFIITPGGTTGTYDFSLRRKELF